MQQIEFTDNHGDYETGDQLFVDELSAKSLVERKLAKIVDSAPAAEVESGGDRARELNAQAAADQAAADEAAATKADVEPAGDDKDVADPAAVEPAVAVEPAGDEKAVETKPAATTRGRAK